MAIPRAMPPHPNFWEPLPSEHEIALPSGARLGLGKLCLKPNLELHVLARRDYPGETHIGHGLVIFIAVVGLNVLQLRGQITLVNNLQSFDLFRAVFLRFPFVVSSIAASFEFSLAYPGRVGLKRILIEMER